MVYGWKRLGLLFTAVIRRGKLFFHIDFSSLPPGSCCSTTFLIYWQPVYRWRFVKHDFSRTTTTHAALIGPNCFFNYSLDDFEYFSCLVRHHTCCRLAAAITLYVKRFWTIFIPSKSRRCNVYNVQNWFVLILNKIFIPRVICTYVYIYTIGNWWQRSNDELGF